MFARPTAPGDTPFHRLRGLSALLLLLGVLSGCVVSSKSPLLVEDDATRAALPGSFVLTLREDDQAGAKKKSFLLLRRGPNDLFMFEQPPFDEGPETEILRAHLELTNKTAKGSEERRFIFGLREKEGWVYFGLQRAPSGDRAVMLLGEEVATRDDLLALFDLGFDGSPRARDALKQLGVSDVEYMSAAIEPAPKSDHALALALLAKWGAKHDQTAAN